MSRLVSFWGTFELTKTSANCLYATKAYPKKRIQVGRKIPRWRSPAMCHTVLCRPHNQPRLHTRHMHTSFSQEAYFEIHFNYFLFIFVMYNIVDSHIHLTAESLKHIWLREHPDVLAGDHRLEEYTSSKDPRYDIDGVIWIEALCSHSLENGMEGMRNAIEECKYVLRYNTKTLEGEGPERPGYVKALIPIIPLPWGPKVAEYVDVLKEELGDQYKIVKGYRYLFQDKPPKTILDPKVVEGMRWLEANNYVFDYGIDVHNGGIWQFEESVELFRQVPNVKYIINHLTKPHLMLDVENVEEHELFIKWKALMTEMYNLTPNSYMKLSGCFSELADDTPKDLKKIADLVFPWFKVTYDLWGAERTMWASNWPVTNVFSADELSSQWFTVSEDLLDRVNASAEDKKKIYETNYRKGYNLD